MPLAPLKPCATQGCRELVRSPLSRCSVHSREYRDRRHEERVRTDRDYAERHAFYWSTPWRKARKTYLASYPLCRECGAIGDMVDHITPIRLGGEQLDPQNFQTLCNVCHARKRQREGEDAKQNV